MAPGSELSVLLPVTVANTTVGDDLRLWRRSIGYRPRNYSGMGLEKQINKRMGRVNSVGQNPVELIWEYYTGSRHWRQSNNPSYFRGVA